jgi:phospholipid/cholesterol/gamma-HCH transport system ATP-binding protein
MHGVKLRFGEKTVLDGVELSIKRSEILVIMGLSGCGKSTLLNLILGLLKPESGSILFQGGDITRVPRAELNRMRTRIGMVYQNAALISSLNVHDNIALPLQELSDKKPNEIDAIVDQKLELVGLKDAREKLPSELSGGMQKRVGLARALALEPELVLFDEPSAGLDPVNSRLIDDLILRLGEKEKVTSIVVTHQMNSAFAVATRMAFLDTGKIILDGPPDTFRQSDNPAVHQFLSSYDAPPPKGT